MIKITKYVVVFAILSIAIYDIIAIAFGGTESSISKFVLDSGTKSPIVILSFGMLMGHFFWPQEKE